MPQAAETTAQKNRYREIAKAAIKGGLCVLPRGSDKFPPFAWKEFQERLPTFEEVEQWDYRDGIVLITGRVSGVVVVDADGEEGRRRLEEYGHPVTPMVESGSGGLHLYFRHPGFEVRNRTQLLPKIDVRGDGGLVVLPPSPHPTTGTPYRWVVSPDDADYAECPEWLLKLLREKAKEPPKYNNLTEDEPVANGHRNATLTSFAGLLWRKGLDSATILAALLAVNQERCDPPLADEEVQKIVESISGYPRGGSPEEGGEKDEEAATRRNLADRLVSYALEEIDELFVDQYGTPHALIGKETVPLNTRCYRMLRRLMWEREGRGVTGEYLKMAAGTLEARAAFEGEERTLYTRAARPDDTLYYELGPGRVIRVEAGGWGPIEDPPVLFRRFPNLKELPDPQPGGSLDVLDKLLNLRANRDRRLLKAYVVTAPLEDVARPVVAVTGTQGAGKTTAARIIKRALDPSTPETIRYDRREILQKLTHCFIAVLDNQGNLSEEAADTICRAVTGEADSKRLLYTPDEDLIVELMRAVVMTGINLPSERGDFLDRTLPLELERIPDADRKTDEELWELFYAELPKLLGAIFETLSRALALKPSLQLSRRPRLADWGEHAAAVYEVLEFSEEDKPGAELFLEDWDEVVNAQTRATLDGSPVAQAIIKFMEDKTEDEEYTATASELHTELETVAEGLGVSIKRDPAWPKSSRWLWRRIKEVLATLATVRIEAKRLRNESGTAIALRKIPKSNASDASGGETPTDKPKTAGNMPGDDVRSNASSNARQKPAKESASCNTGNTDNIFAPSSGGADGGLSVEDALAEKAKQTPTDSGWWPREEGRPLA